MSWPTNINEAATFGLEMQQPWSMHLLKGRKTIEVRNYLLPDPLIGRQIFIIESQSGQDGISALGDEIDLTDNCSDDALCRVVGWCEFGSIKEYKSSQDFQDDEAYHLVSRDSGYAWKEGKTNILYGWVVKEAGRFEDGHSKFSFNYAVRRHRSIFQLSSNSKPN